MLRSTLLVIGLGLCASYFVAPLFAWHCDIVVLWWGLILVLGLALERWRYHSTEKDLSKDLSKDWEATDERFYDPETGQAMQVFYHRHSGERAYRPYLEVDTTTT